MEEVFLVYEFFVLIEVFGDGFGASFDGLFGVHFSGNSEQFDRDFVVVLDEANFELSGKFSYLLWLERSDKMSNRRRFYSDFARRYMEIGYSGHSYINRDVSVLILQSEHYFPMIIHITLSELQYVIR